MKVAELQKKIEPILRSHGIERASVFGSVARGTDGRGSDVDLLVRFGRPTGMIAFMHFIGEIEHALGRKVDVVTENSLSKYIRPHVEADLQTIYES